MHDQDMWLSPDDDISSPKFYFPTIFCLSCHLVHLECDQLRLYIRAKIISDLGRSENVGGETAHFHIVFGDIDFRWNFPSIRTPIRDGSNLYEVLVLEYDVIGFKHEDVCN